MDSIAQFLNKKVSQTKLLQLNESPTITWYVIIVVDFSFSIETYISIT